MLRITGLFTIGSCLHNNQKACGGRGLHSARSVTPPTLHSTHILAGLQTCGLLIRPAKALEAVQAASKQPERYVQCALNSWE